MLTGSIPLVALPKKYLLRGMILVEAPAGIRTRVETVGLRRLDPSIVNDLAVETDPKDDAGNRPDRSSASRQVVHAFAYTEAASRLDLSTELLTPSRVDRDRPGGHPHDVRRSQRIVPEPPAPAGQFRGGAFARSGSIPEDDAGSCSPRRIRRRSDPVESRDIDPDPVVEPRTEIEHDRRRLHGRGRPDRRWRAQRPELPLVSLPCLSFVWELVTPPDWKAVDRGPGLIAGDREGGSGWPLAALGLGIRPWSFPWGRRAARNTDWLRTLDDRLVDSVSDELTFAEWLSRWDSGPWPIVVDRLALSSAGFGPKSQCVPSRGQRRAARYLVDDPAAVRVGAGSVPERSRDHDRGGGVEI